jgi:hypothetical protein
MGLRELFERLFGAGREPARVDEVEGSVFEEDFDGVDPFDPFPEPVRLEIKDVFDLHSIPPREVRVVVVEYLREARMKGFRQVRIIHGKGIGVQREAVRSILALTPFVENFTDAPPEAGGWGTTVVKMKEEQ